MKKVLLKGASNARDFGGTQIGSKTVKSDCFLRSNHIGKLSDKDILVLKEHKIQTVIDLRTGVERTDEPDREIDGVTNIHIPVFSEAVMGITHENNQNKKEMLEHLPDMTQLYRLIVTDNSCIAQLKKVFAVICSSDESGSVLWHCTEGKDRCGLVSAFFLFLLGADRKTVYQDYLETNATAKKRSDRLYFFVKYLLRKPHQAQLVRQIFLAKEEYLDAALGAVEETCGSIDNFIRDKLGVSDETKEEMRRRFLE